MDAVLHTGAGLLAANPATSMSAIAEAAGVDRRTVYRRFATREALVAAVFNAKLAAVEQVLDAARLMEAPVAVALHRYVEGAVLSVRLWPVELKHSGDRTVEARRQAVHDRTAAFVDRAVGEGFFRADLSQEWIHALLDHTVHLAAHHFPDLGAPQCADLVVKTLLTGLRGATA
jgi:AcrR family transcriptional regulator